jgi:3-deoxy-manno-octulosonate cytidylyltransferase (CMP-KDO synthetase)
MNILGVIPARYGSTRLPGKPLADICGKPLIQHVYEKASSSSLGALIVATDDERIIKAVQAFNGNAVLTSEKHPNGTSRAAEVAEKMNVDYVINIQGDEPLLDPRMIDEVIHALTENEDVVSATLCAPILDKASLSNPNVVKVVKDRRDFALYFSRSPIPYMRVETALPVYEHKIHSLPQCQVNYSFKGFKDRILQHARNCRRIRTYPPKRTVQVQVCTVKKRKIPLKAHSTALLLLLDFYL